MTSNTKKKGDCEACVDAIGVDLTLMVGNIWMCSTCAADQRALSTATAQATINHSRKIDSVIQLKADVFVSATKAFTELQAAVLADDSIPTERKAIALLDLVAARIETLATAIFDRDKITDDMRTEKFTLQKQAQAVVGKLRESEKAKYKAFDVNYQPPVVKVTKPRKPAAAPKPRFNLKEAKAVIAKYAAEGLILNIIALQVTATNKSMNAEDAARYMADKIRG